MVLRDWVAEHIRKYRESDGAEGHIWHGVNGDLNVPCLLLTTRGSKSGEERTAALIYGQDGDNHVVVASRGGTPESPTWYGNLAANPEVQVQVLADKFSATARTATGDERARLWTMMAEIFPSYNDYQEKAKASREIPVIVLERS